MDNMNFKKMSNDEILDVYKTFEDFIEYLKDLALKEKNVGEDNE